MKYTTKICKCGHEKEKHHWSEKTQSGSMNCLFMVNNTEYCPCKKFEPKDEN